MNLVFHGAEHSRFAHSMGAAHVACKMFDAIARNTPDQVDVATLERDREDTILATLLHDVGHGPFSHTLEEITEAIGVPFHHEAMTTRILGDDGSDVCEVLKARDPELPARLIPFIDKKRRNQLSPRWYHAITSSQLDADRLDYLIRDAYMAGIRTHSFDLARLIGALGVRKDEIVVDARARDVVDSYLLALDHMYASAYYHHTNRAASFLLTSILRRSVDLAHQDDADRASLFPPLSGGSNPLWQLLMNGQALPLADYQQLEDSIIWTHITLWSTSADPILKGLVDDLNHRRLPKSIATPTGKIDRKQLESIAKQAEAEFRAKREGFDPRYFIHVDLPTRRTYTSSGWSEGYADSIKLIGADGGVTALERDPLSLVKVLDERKPYPSLIVPPWMRDFVTTRMKELS